MRRALWLLVVTALSCDPVHDNAVDALGGETRGVPPGPFHRPGQACILCHDGTMGNPPAFSMAGTVYVDRDSQEPAAGAVVSMTDSSGVSFRSGVNEAGNFYVTPREWVPAYPVKVTVDYGDTRVNMTALIGRDGSCAGCHSDPASSSSPGHVYIPADGITP